MPDDVVCQRGCNSGKHCKKKCKQIRQRHLHNTDMAKQRDNNVNESPETGQNSDGLANFLVPKQLIKIIPMDVKSASLSKEEQSRGTENKAKTYTDVKVFLIPKQGIVQ